MSDQVNDRGNLMESLFFKRQDQALLQRLRDKQLNQEIRDQLIGASGALSMIPLVTVAWADREVQDTEKAAILTAADSAGIHKDSDASELLAAWLVERPESDLLDAWKSYTAAVKEVTDPAAFGQLKTAVLGTAKAVAESAGGILGLGNKTSAAEQKVLDDLESAF